MLKYYQWGQQPWEGETWSAQKAWQSLWAVAEHEVRFDRGWPPGLCRFLLCVLLEWDLSCPEVGGRLDLCPASVPGFLPEKSSRAPFLSLKSSWVRGACLVEPIKQTHKGEKASTRTLHAQTYYTPVPCQGGFVGSNVTTHDRSSNTPWQFWLQRWCAYCREKGNLLEYLVC